jgi:hypothetical protein
VFDELYRFYRFLYASGLRWERALNMGAAELDEVLVDPETPPLLSGGLSWRPNGSMPSFWRVAPTADWPNA